MTPPTVLITGSGQRLGLALALLYASRGWRVFAAENEQVDAHELQGFESIRMVSMDVRDQTSITAAAVALSGEAIDVLINAAAFTLGDGLYELSQGDLLAQLETNCVAPFLITRAFLPNLQLAVAKNGVAKVVNCSSRVDGNDDTSSGGYYGHRMAASSVRTLTKLLADDLKGDKITVFEADLPTKKEGSTDTSEEATMQEVVDSLMELIDRVGLEDSGLALHACGGRSRG